MASPSTVFTEMVTTTLRAVPEMTPADNVSANNALYSRLRSKGKIKKQSGGYEIQVPACSCTAPERALVQIQRGPRRVAPCRARFRGISFRCRSCQVLDLGHRYTMPTGSRRFIAT